MFTVDLAIEDDALVYGEKVVYGRPLFSHLKHLDIPNIIPFEKAGKETRVTFDNMNEKVFLFLGDEIE